MVEGRERWSEMEGGREGGMREIEVRDQESGGQGV